MREFGLRGAQRFGGLHAIRSTSKTSRPSGISTTRAKRWRRLSGTPSVGPDLGKVYTSKYNRAYETAVIAGFKDIEKTADLTEGGLVVSPNENNRRIEAFHKMLGTGPKTGTNTILITHKPNIVDVLGKDWFDVKEGEASLFRPENGSYKVLARVQMDEWPRIAAAK